MLGTLRRMLGKRQLPSIEDRLARRQKAVLERSSKALGGDPLLEKLIRDADYVLFNGER